MTREELIEDVKIGDFITLHTESDETFTGKVIDLGAGGLKINLSNKDVAKRISYDRIKEYDIENESTVNTVTANISSVEKQKNELSREYIQDKSETFFKGEIYAYHQDKKNGFIKESDGNTIYFDIKQVKDIMLQKLLFDGTYHKKRVTYRKGINIFKIIAADAIVLYENYYEGLLKYYNSETRYGTIKSGNNSYGFIAKEIKDKYLLADLYTNFNESRFHLDVNFKIKPHITRNGETRQIAFDIYGKKDYSPDEIKDFINNGYIQNHELFEKVQYEPLEPIISSTNTNKAKNLTLKTGNVNSLTPKFTIQAANIQHEKMQGNEDEEKAISLLLPNNDNPFEALVNEIKNSKNNNALSFLVSGSNSSNITIKTNELKHAATSFINAIQLQVADKIHRSICTLIHQYNKEGGDYIVKGIQLLEYFKYLFTPEELTNHRMNLILKSGNSEACKLIHLAVIKTSNKENSVVHSMNQLARLYFKDKEWENASKQLEENLKYLDNIQNSFQDYEKRKQTNRFNLILSRYNDAQKTNNEQKLSLVRQEAQVFLNENPDFAEKNSNIIKKIVDAVAIDEIDITNNNNDDDIDIVFEDYVRFNYIEGLSNYLKTQLASANIKALIDKKYIPDSKIENGSFHGNSEDVEKIITEIQEKQNQEKQKRIKFSSEVNKDIYIGIAKLISDVLKFNQYNKLSLHYYIARYARYQADCWIEHTPEQVIDSIRYMYIQALKFRYKNHQEYIYIYNMLVSTFFYEPDSLAKHLPETSIAKEGSIFSKKCIDVKDLLIATFMLKDNNSVKKRILSSIYKDNEMKQKSINIMTMNEQVKENINIDSEDVFKKLWLGACNNYYDKIDIIRKEIEKSVNDCLLIESTRKHHDNINTYINSIMLWNQDKQRLCDFLDIISEIIKTLGKNSKNEQIDGFLSIYEKVCAFQNRIETEPTELSYDYISNYISILNNKILTKLNDLYQSSVPDIKISSSDDNFFANETKVQITITFKNERDKQNAESVEIQLSGSEGAKFDECVKNISSIKSGESQDYVGTFVINNEVISNEQFELNINLKYCYKSSYKEIKNSTIKTTLQVNIIDKKKFTEIENIFQKINKTTDFNENPDLFKGRDELLDKICNYFSNPSIPFKKHGIMLWGQARVGKTCLKNYLKERIKKEYPESYLIFDIGSVSDVNNLRGLLSRIIRMTVKISENDYKDIYDSLKVNILSFDEKPWQLSEDDYKSDFQSFMYCFINELKSLDIHHPVPLYFFDEFTIFYEWIEDNPDNGKKFMRFWKAFIENYDIGAITITHDNYPTWEKKYQNEFACMKVFEISYLPEKGAKELISAPCEKNKVSFSPEAIELIYKLTRGSASLIVSICEAIIDHLNEHYILKVSKTVVQAVLKKHFIEDKVKIFADGDFEPQTLDRAFVGKNADEINKLNVQLLEEIAYKTIDSDMIKKDDLDFLKSDNRSDILQRLKERKIIDENKIGNFSIHMPLLKLYLLKRQGALSEEIFSKLTEKLLAN